MFICFVLLMFLFCLDSPVSIYPCRIELNTIMMRNQKNSEIVFISRPSFKKSAQKVSKSPTYLSSLEVESCHQLQPQFQILALFCDCQLELQHLPDLRESHVVLEISDVIPG